MNKLSPVLVMSVLIGLLLTGQWLSPYSMPEANSLQPPEIPTITSSDENKFLSYILEHNLWDEKRGRIESSESTDSDAEAKADAAEQGGSGWQLLAVTQKNGNRIAVVNTGGTIASFSVGDSLVDDTVIVSISAYNIEISESGKIKNVFLFGKE